MTTSDKRRYVHQVLGTHQRIGIAGFRIITLAVPSATMEADSPHVGSRANTLLVDIYQRLRRRRPCPLDVMFRRTILPRSRGAEKAPVQCGREFHTASLFPVLEQSPCFGGGKICTWRGKNDTTKGGILDYSLGSISRDTPFVRFVVRRERKME